MLSTAAYCSEKSDSKKPITALRGLRALKTQNIPTVAEWHSDDEGFTCQYCFFTTPWNMP